MQIKLGFTWCLIMQGDITTSVGRRSSVNQQGFPIHITWCTGALLLQLFMFNRSNCGHVERPRSIQWQDYPICQTGIIFRPMWLTVGFQPKSLASKALTSTSFKRQNSKEPAMKDESGTTLGLGAHEKFKLRGPILPCDMDIWTTTMNVKCNVYAQYVSLGGEENTSYFLRLEKDLCLKQKGVK